MKVDVVIPTKNGDIHQQLLTTLKNADWVNNIIITQVAPVNLARQQAVSQASGEWVAMIDSDVTVPSNWLSHFESSLTEDVGAASSPAQVTDPAELAYMRILKCFPILHHTDLYPYANNMLVRRSLMTDGYKPCPQFWGEDLYLGKQIREKGYRWIVLPKLGVVHHGKIHDSVNAGITYGKNRHYSYKQLLRRSLARLLFVPWAALTSLSIHVFYILMLEHTRFFAGWLKSRLFQSEREFKIMDKYMD
jgi:glycosyltransferase involved in cell wall biosynthesis